jgi:hypothetical protein
MAVVVERAMDRAQRRLASRLRKMRPKGEERLVGAVFSNLTIKGCGCPISNDFDFPK